MLNLNFLLFVELATVVSVSAGAAVPTVESPGADAVPTVSPVPDAPAALSAEDPAALPSDFPAALPTDCPSGPSTADEELIDFLNSQSQSLLDSGLETADPSLALSQVSASSTCYSPEKRVIEKPRFIHALERTGANNRAGKFFFLAFFLSKLELIIHFLATKMLKRSYFGKYLDKREEVVFCVVEMLIATKKETIREELQASKIIVNTPLLLTYLSDPRELFIFLHATEELTYTTQFHKIEKKNLLILNCLLIML